MGFAAWVLPGVVLLWTTTVADGLSVWVAPSLQRVGRSDTAGSQAAAALRAARGEYQSFQIVIQAPAGSALTGADVTVTDLAGPGAQVISNSNITLYREQYVHAQAGSPDRLGANRPLGAGWYPDALIPFVDPQTGQKLSGAALTAAPFSVPAGQNQPIWVDVFVPRDAGAGRYSGSFTVACDQGTFSGPLTLDVWAFTLPSKPTLNSSFLIWTPTGVPAIQELLRNKLNPSKVPRSAEQQLIDGFGLSATDLGFWSGADMAHCTMSPPPSLDALTKAATSRTPDLYLYNYTADEIARCPSLVEPVRQWARRLHEAGVPSLVTMAPRPDLMDDGSGSGRSAVDIWAMLPGEYDRNVNKVLAAQSKGDAIWSYNALVQDSYSPKWEIDFDPINFRIQPGFISQSLGLTGLLYWRVDLWTSSPWTEVNSTGFTRYPGEGMLVYPGGPVGIQGVAPSMRLKWIRDGVQDYEYVDLLKKAGLGAWALEVAATVGADWSHWTRDRQALEDARVRLGTQLSGLSAQPSSARADSEQRRPPRPRAGGGR